MSISLAHCITQKNHFFTSAQPLGSHSPVLIHMHVHSTYLLSHCITQESHLKFIISTLCSEEANTSSSSLSHDDAPKSMGIHTFTLCSATCMSNSADLLSHCVTQENHLEYHIISTLCTEEANTSFHLCLRMIHPTHGLSLRSTHSVYVLEDVSRSCNHQHSLSAREAFSTRPSLERKYSNFVLASGLVKIYVIFSWVGRYCTCIVFL